MYKVFTFFIYLLSFWLNILKGIKDDTIINKLIQTSHANICTCLTLPRNVQICSDVFDDQDRWDRKVVGTNTDRTDVICMSLSQIRAIVEGMVVDGVAHIITGGGSCYTHYHWWWVVLHTSSLVVGGVAHIITGVGWCYTHYHRWWVVLHTLSLVVDGVTHIITGGGWCCTHHHWWWVVLHTSSLVVGRVADIITGGGWCCTHHHWWWVRSEERRVGKECV